MGRPDLSSNNISLVTLILPMLGTAKNIFVTLNGQQIKQLINNLSETSMPAEPVRRDRGIDVTKFRFIVSTRNL